MVFIVAAAGEHQRSSWCCHVKIKVNVCTTCITWSVDNHNSQHIPFRIGNCRRWRNGRDIRSQLNVSNFMCPMIGRIHFSHFKVQTVLKKMRSFIRASSTLSTPVVCCTPHGCRIYSAFFVAHVRLVASVRVNYFARSCWIIGINHMCCH